jgi:8-oxo-dGTP pyrophosphatase MutT (NUDIX family)
VSSKAAKYQFRVAVHAVMTRNVGHGPQVLLGLRQNTSYGDGFWSFPAGHQESHETSAQALVRELDEEIKVVPVFNTIAAVPALTIEHLKDYGADHPEQARRFRHYFDLYYRVPQWRGRVVNNEPDKCAGLRFFPLAQLPDNTLPLTRYALECLARPGCTQARFGWDNPEYPAWRAAHPGP